MESILSFMCILMIDITQVSKLVHQAISLAHNLDFGCLPERGFGIEKSVSGPGHSWDLPAHHPLFCCCDKPSTKGNSRKRECIFPIVPERVHNDGESWQQAANMEKTHVKKLGVQMQNKERTLEMSSLYAPKALCQWHTFFSKVAVLTPLRIVSTTGNQLSKHWRL